MKVRVSSAKSLSGEVEAPGDKSISHRALIFSALAEGECQVSHLSPGADVRSSGHCLSLLGAKVHVEGDRARVQGAGLDGLRSPSEPLDCGNSGTTIRLLSGVVAGAGLTAELFGDESLSRRPMRRVLEPLRAMGAKAEGTRDAKGEEKPPLRFTQGSGLKGVRHDLAIASAQVKTCLLLAGLWAEGTTIVREPSDSRDHTERMLASFGAPLRRLDDGAWSIGRPPKPMRAPSQIYVPGDPSSAAFLVAAAVLVPGGEVQVKDICTNPTRIGFLKVLERMGADVALEGVRDLAGEPVGAVRARYRQGLRATTVTADEVPSLVDEIPMLAVVATQAEGLTEIRGAGELRVKESDRISQVARGLLAMGARVEELPDGLKIHGPTALRGAAIDAAQDHRIAMSFAVAGLIAQGQTEVEGAEWADISFPGFFRLLSKLTGGAVES